MLWQQSRFILSLLKVGDTGNAVLLLSVTLADEEINQIYLRLSWMAAVMEFRELLGWSGLRRCSESVSRTVSVLFEGTQMLFQFISGNKPTGASLAG